MDKDLSIVGEHTNDVIVQDWCASTFTDKNEGGEEDDDKTGDINVQKIQE